MTTRTFVALALAAPTLLIAAVPAGAATRSCADSDRFLQQLHATNLGCKKANSVMFGWAKSSKCIKGGTGTLASRTRDCTVLGYACHAKKAEGGVSVRCASGNRSLRFFDSQG